MGWLGRARAHLGRQLCNPIISGLPPRAGWGGGRPLTWLVHLQVEGAADIRLAGIGGLSALLGWTEVQQQTSKGFLGGGSNIIKAVR